MFPLSAATRGPFIADFIFAVGPNCGNSSIMESWGTYPFTEISASGYVSSEISRGLLRLAQFFLSGLAMGEEVGEVGPLNLAR